MIWKNAVDRERDGYIKISKSTLIYEDEIPEDQRKNMITGRAIFTMKPIQTLNIVIEKTISVILIPVANFCLNITLIRR